MKKADASILAANYNNGRFLRAFINSIMASRVLPSRIIIVDDGSTDESRAVLDEFKDNPLLHCIYLEKNQGFANALNAGLERVDTAFVLRADPDDRFLPDRIAAQIHFLETHPELSGAGCNVMYFRDKDNASLWHSAFPEAEKMVGETYRRGEHGMQHPSIAFRTKALQQYRYRQETVPAEDYDLLARMVKDGHRFANLPDILYEMRIHTASVSSSLKMDTIRKTFALRDAVFGTKTASIHQLGYFLHIRHYRKALLSTHKAARFGYLLLSALFYPGKLLKRRSFFRSKYESKTNGCG
jgi:glycosyltransferase involved in cell wall biosynthesis